MMEKLLWAGALLVPCLAGCAAPRTPTCGDGHVDSGEACDDGDRVTEPCAYGTVSCEVCDADCRLTPGQVLQGHPENY